LWFFDSRTIDVLYKNKNWQLIFVLQVIYRSQYIRKVFLHPLWPRNSKNNADILCNWFAKICSVYSELTYTYPWFLISRMTIIQSYTKILWFLPSGKTPKICTFWTFLRKISIWAICKFPGQSGCCWYLEGNFLDVATIILYHIAITHH